MKLLYLLISQKLYYTTDMCWKKANVRFLTAILLQSCFFFIIFIYSTVIKEHTISSSFVFKKSV